MKGANSDSDLYIIEQSEGEPVIVEGELTRSNAGEFQSRLRSLNLKPGRAVTLDLTGLDIEDGIAIATVINAIRELRAVSAGVIIRGAPQILGHNLYRVGMLEGGSPIRLVDMRLDEPHG